MVQPHATRALDGRQRTEERVESSCAAGLVRGSGRRWCRCWPRRAQPACASAASRAASTAARRATAPAHCSRSSGDMVLQTLRESAAAAPATATNRRRCRRPPLPPRRHPPAVAVRPATRIEAPRRGPTAAALAGGRGRRRRCDREAARRLTPAAPRRRGSGRLASRLLAEVLGRRAVVRHRSARSSAGSGGVWPSAANISVVGRNRSAAFGTRSTLVRLRDLDVDVRRHARLQLQLRVRHVDDGRVGHDVLLTIGLQADLRHRAA